MEKPTLRQKVQDLRKKRAVTKVVRKSKKGAALPPILQMLVVIVERDRGSEVSDYLKTHGISSRVISFGQGTANSALQSVLGLYNKEKEIVYSVIPIEKSDSFLDDLEEKLYLKDKQHGGIAFTIPLKSITKNSMQFIIIEF